MPGSSSLSSFSPVFLPGDAFFLGGDLRADTTGTHSLRLIWPRVFLVAMGVWQTALRVRAEGVLRIFSRTDLGMFEFILVMTGSGTMTRVRGVM